MRFDFFVFCGLTGQLLCGGGVLLKLKIQPQAAAFHTGQRRGEHRENGDQQTGGQPNPQRLITEEKARAMVKAGGPVQVPQGAIVTPSAKDVLLRSKLEIVWGV